MVRRGQVWLVTFDPTFGVEIQKTRPALVISPDELNSRLPLVTVAPLTSGSRPAPFRVPTTFQDKPGLILPEQLHSVDKRQLVKLLGEVDAPTLTRTLTILAAFFAP